jgi:hypothetical protein
MNALAQRWTIQAFAYAASARAEAVTERLRGVGFDAYTDTLPGSSLVLVRIGCFGAQADADALAQDVRERVAADALVIPFQEGAEATVCVERELGFIPPAAWGLAATSSEQVTFWLEAQGRRYISFDGERWELRQTATQTAPQATTTPEDTDLLGEILATPPSTGPGATFRATFRATRSRGLPLVRADLGGGSLLVAAGTLLWSSAQAAVVQQGADVFALRLYRP